MVISTRVARFLEATGVSGDKIIISLLSSLPFQRPFSTLLLSPFHSLRTPRGGGEEGG